jgi:hypothetical protein
MTVGCVVTTHPGQAVVSAPAYLPPFRYGPGCGLRLEPYREEFHLQRLCLESTLIASPSRAPSRRWLHFNGPLTSWRDRWGRCRCRRKLADDCFQVGNLLGQCGIFLFCSKAFRTQLLDNCLWPHALPPL